MLGESKQVLCTLADSGARLAGTGQDSIRGVYCRAPARL
jgi:hypothetical protein